jgi:hypothetical protein
MSFDAQLLTPGDGLRLAPAAELPTLGHPGGPVRDGSTYAAVAPDGRTISVRYLPAGAAFPVLRGQDVRYVRVGLAQTISYG